MSYEKEFEKFLKKKGNGHLGFLRLFATMEDDQVIYWDDNFHDKVLWHQSWLTPLFIREYEKANYAKYMHALDFDMDDFTYADCIESDINGLFKELDCELRERLIRDYKRLREYEQHGDRRCLKKNIFVG